MVMTDSGGIQEETTVLGVPCLTLRENAERPVTVKKGTNRLVGISPMEIERAIKSLLKKDFPAKPVIDLWDGKAGVRIAGILI